MFSYINRVIQVFLDVESSSASEDTREQRGLYFFIFIVLLQGGFQLQ